MNKYAFPPRYVPADTLASIPFSVPVVATGNCAADQPLTSPVTQKPCVYFEYILEPGRRKQKMTEAILHGNGRELANLKNRQFLFYLQDKSGKMLIKPRLRGK